MNSITLTFGGETSITADEKFTQFDYGQQIIFGDLELPSPFEVHFSNMKVGKATTQIGEDNVVIVPDEYLATGLPLYGWVYLHESDSDGETEYTFKIGVTRRAIPKDAITPEQEQAITRAIALLQHPIDNIEEIVNEALAYTTVTLEELQATDAELRGDIETTDGAVSTLAGRVGTNETNITSLDTRVNNLAHLTEGSTTGDAELIDGRVGADNVTYTNIGTAIRTQFSNLKSGIDHAEEVLGEPDDYRTTNLFDTSTLIQSKYLNQQGQVIDAPNDTYWITPMIDIGYVDRLYETAVNTSNILIGCYDENQAFIDYISKNHGTISDDAGGVFRTLFLPNRTRYIIATNRTTWLNSLVLCKYFYPDRYIPAGTYVSREPATTASKAELAFIGTQEKLLSCDLNSLYGVSKLYLLSDSETYTNLPADFGVAGFLQVMTSYKWTIQIAYHFVTGKVWKRRANSSNSWSDWVLIGGGNSYTFNHYENTYDVTASPSITTDTNSYLAPSGDTTDRTSEIVTMLTQTGCCRLGKGDYYVTDLVMPDNTSIIGCGDASRIILSGTSDGFAIKMGSYCTVRDVFVTGKASGSITITETLGGRDGILWEGNWTEAQTATSQPFNGKISNVTITNFIGSGIRLYDTGQGTANCLEVCNVWMRRCSAGINVDYESEFNKFTNVRTYLCYYGCINNGGNNVFVNCDFSECTMCLLMDNSQSQSPNNSHGSMVGCVFNHAGKNADIDGIGIKILGNNYGFIFSACQIFYSKTVIENSSGIAFESCNYGANNCDITINGGGAILFLGNIHQAQPTVSITDNDHVMFVNSYVRSNGALVTA